MERHELPSNVDYYRSERRKEERLRLLSTLRKAVETSSPSSRTTRIEIPRVTVHRLAKTFLPGKYSEKIFRKST